MYTDVECQCPVPSLTDSMLFWSAEYQREDVQVSHYRLTKIRQQDLAMEGESGDYGLMGGEGAGTAKAKCNDKEKKEEALSLIIDRQQHRRASDARRFPESHRRRHSGQQRRPSKSNVPTAQ